MRKYRICPGPAITLDEAKQLRPGTILYSRKYANADDSPARYKVNGTVITWKTRPERVKVPLKRGLYEHGYMYEFELDDYSMTLEVVEYE